MTRLELDKIIARVGGLVRRVDMLTQITRAQDSPLARSLADRPKGTEALYEFFCDDHPNPLSGYYLEIDDSPDPAFADYDSSDTSTAKKLLLIKPQISSSPAAHSHLY